MREARWMRSVGLLPTLLGIGSSHCGRWRRRGFREGRCGRRRELVSPDGPGAPGRERGSGTAAMLGVLGAGIVLLTAVALLVGVVRVRAMAQTAADMAALAGASVLSSPTSTRSPCVAAEEAASAAGARLSRCDVDGAFVTTRAEVRSMVGTASAEARAGPA